MDFIINTMDKREPAILLYQEGNSGKRRAKGGFVEDVTLI